MKDERALDGLGDVLHCTLILINGLLDGNSGGFFVLFHGSLISANGVNGVNREAANWTLGD